MMSVVMPFYVDESRDRGSDGHHYFAGLLGDGNAIANAEAQLERVAEQAYDDGLARDGSELHAAEIFSGSKVWQRGTIPQRAALLEAALAVTGSAGVEVIARGTNMKRFQKRYGTDADPYVWEFSNLLERLNERLTSLDDYGLVISDQQAQHRDRIQRDVADSKRYGTGGYRSQKLERILDTAHFVDSKLSRMIQLADMSAFILRRRASHKREHDPRLEALMQHLAQLVYDCVPEPTGQYHTVRAP